MIIYHDAVCFSYVTSASRETRVFGPWSTV